jgi:hypothetical protein
VWLDRSPYSFHAALEDNVNSGLFDAMIPGFALHWDLEDLTKAMGSRPVLWTDPTTWMNKIAVLKAPFQYRYILGDATDLSDAEDNRLLAEFLK